MDYQSELIDIYIDEESWGHGDMNVRIGSHTTVCDSYYLWSDPIYPDDFPRKDLCVLKLLVSQWYSLILQTKDGESVLLPFDFSDEYTGCFKVMCALDEVIISIVATNDPNGIGISPSSIIDFAKRNLNLMALSEKFQYSVTYSKNQILNDLQKLISKISNQIDSTI